MLLAGSVSHISIKSMILSKFSMLYWICTLSILLFVMGIELFHVYLLLNGLSCFPGSR